jgi:sugar/nucleoside kinase (ribokinase family)
VHQLGSPTHAEASPVPEDIRDASADARAFHIAPIPVECQARLLEPLSARGDCLLSLDPHDPLRAGTLGLWRRLLPRLDLLFVSEEEISIPGLDRDPGAALAELAGGRLKAVALKRGDRGGIYYEVDSRRAIVWPARAERTIDPTGAGDAFAGGFLSGRLAGLALGDSLTRGIVSASFALDDWGSAGLFAATTAEAQRRFDAWRGAVIE